ncbi:hypothetical protein BJ741DRAFT_622811 [Chytriomyces cf. hyalinus JEL632]|nr:hypothetical protein BJ741DRAFT_622811 [Chytriomyces cf. hyalinus JEL632]
MSRRAGCLSMAGSSVCGSDFETQFAYIDPLEAARSFKDLATFDQYMTSFADDNPQFKINMDLYGCTRFNGTGLRYHMTAYCAVWAYQGHQWCFEGAAAPSPVVCRESVENFMNSWGEVVNEGQCPGWSDAAAVKARQSYYSLFSNLLASETLPLTACAVAVPIDASTYCGYRTALEAQPYCARTSATCCAFNTTPATPSESPTPVFSNTVTNPGPSSTFPMLAIALIAALVVIIVAAISVYIFRRRHRLATTKPSTPEPSAPPPPPPLVHSKTTLESTAQTIQRLGSRAYTVQDASRGYSVLAEKRRPAEEFMNGAFHGPNAVVIGAANVAENSDTGNAGSGTQHGLELANFVRGRAATTFEKRDLTVPNANAGPSGAGARISTMQSDPKLWNEERVADFVYANGGNMNSYKIVKEQHIDGMKLLTHSFETLTLVLQIPVEKHAAFEAALAALRFRILNQEASLSRPPAYQSI